MNDTLGYPYFIQLFGDVLWKGRRWQGRHRQHDFDRLRRAFAIVGAAAPAYANEGARTVSIAGEVSSPATFTRVQLAALPQTTVSVTVRSRQFTYTGVLLETLVTTAKPAFPSSLLNTKNELLRVTATIRGADHDDEITFAVGELDPNFGNHPALLALTENGRAIEDGPELVVPGDRDPVRFVRQVAEVTVGIATASATNTTPTAGSPVVVVDGNHQVTLSAARLARIIHRRHSRQMSPSSALEFGRISGRGALANSYSRPRGGSMNNPG